LTERLKKHASQKLTQPDNTGNPQTSQGEEKDTPDSCFHGNTSKSRYNGFQFFFFSAFESLNYFSTFTLSYFKLL
jgi:hypothetical protein